MASDYEDLPETPVVSRRIVKLTRKKNTSSKVKSKKGSKDDVDVDEELAKLPENSPLVKSLDISKILGKMKNPSNYSGYSTNSSFNGNSNSNNNWKTESLFDDNGEDELFPDLNIEEQLKKKKERQREIRKQKEKAKVLEKENLLRDKATKIEDSNPPLYPSSSPAKEMSPIVPTLPFPPPPSPPPAPVKKRGRPRKNPPKQQTEVIKKDVPKKKELTKQKKEPSKVTNRKRKAQAEDGSNKEKPTATKRPRSKSNKKEVPKTTKKVKKPKADTSSSFSLFEVLDFDDSRDADEEARENSGVYNAANNSDHDVFVLESPVKKGRKRKNVKSNDVKKPIATFDGHDSDFEEKKKIAEQEMEHLKEQERREILAEIAKHEREEKERLRQEREEKLEQEKLEAEQEKQRLKESRRKQQVERQKKAKKLEMLEKLRESTSSIMNKKVETIIIPLKDANEDTSNSNIKLRRSSLTARGRRLSSVGNGFVATPHDDIPNNELHKHIDMSLPDSHKLKQLLVWLGKRLIKHGWGDEFENEQDDDVKMKAKMICQIILEEFVNDLIQGQIDVDWWGSSKTVRIANEPIIVHKNKENVENENKLNFYENEAKKLEREEKIWQELKVKNTGTEHDLVLKEIQSPQPTFVSNERYPLEENKKLQDLVEVSGGRVNKLERLVHRLQVSNQLIQRIMSQKNELVAQQIKQQSRIDALDLLRKA
ncbi:hypothetical protein PMKS-001199 [Pichia membranifaciens]|uniref:Uncharacterized protein n=1 Tax=Pichia membranifaciens TaxID=4926 RepID=A0A1Q2YE03_9ASCO|nr:hypothetical protein PMKS-001199 [Pichia membranifaciens]